MARHTYFSSLWKRISLTLSLKLNFDIWRTSEDKLFQILKSILEKIVFEYLFSNVKENDLLFAMISSRKDEYQLDGLNRLNILGGVKLFDMSCIIIATDLK